MTSRTAAVTLIAMSTFVLSTGAAAAHPSPDRRPRQAATTTVTGTVLADLVAAHARASTADKPRLHNEITLLVNLGSAALR